MQLTRLAGIDMHLLGVIAGSGFVIKCYGPPAVSQTAHIFVDISFHNPDLQRHIDLRLLLSSVGMERRFPHHPSGDDRRVSVNYNVA